MNSDFRNTAILFDLDGTLVDTADDLAASMNHALSASGCDLVPPAEVRHLVGYGARRMLVRGYQIAAQREASDDELDAALERFLAHYQENIAVHSRPFAGAIEMIESFRANGARFAICTNKREAMAVLLLETLGIASLFDTIVGADTTLAAKPDPAPVRLCLERTQAKRGIFVGDSDTDIRAAMAANMPCFIARFGYGPLTLADQASGLFDNYEEGAPMIERALRA